jgi:hypothetical protein
VRFDVDGQLEPMKGDDSNERPLPPERGMSTDMSTFRGSIRRDGHVARRSAVTALGLAATLHGGLAAAQTPPPAPPAPPAAPGAATAIQGVTPAYVDKPDVAKAGRKQGWDPRISIGGSLNFANNNSVVGQADGSSLSIGLKLDAGLDYNLKDHEWRNSLGALASTAHTPVISGFVKTSDNLNFDSIYLYHVVPSFGPFARFSYNTSMFPGADVRPAPVNYVITGADGSVRRITADRLHVSDAFLPSTFKESIGLFVQPYRSTPVTLELRGGAGAQEVLANNQLSVTGTPKPVAGMPFDPFEIDVKGLKDVRQVGAELALSVWGTFADKKVAYKVNADAMTPLAHDPLAAGDKRNAFELTNIQVDGMLSFKLVSWASLDYQLRAIRQPQVVDNFQVQNLLLLTFGISYGGNPPPPPPCTPCAPAPPPPAPPEAPPPPATPAPAAPPPAPAPAAPPAVTPAAPTDPPPAPPGAP